MTTIYYLSTIILFWSELTWLITPLEKAIKAEAFNQMKKANKDKDWDSYPEDYKTALKRKIHFLWIPIWLFVGLFTFQWVAFLVFLVYLVIMASVIKLVKNIYIKAAIHWIVSLIGFAFCVFVIANHYHLKIDLTQFIFTLFNF